jgi:hypothetical protein
MRVRCGGVMFEGGMTTRRVHDITNQAKPVARLTINAEAGDNLPCDSLTSTLAIFGRHHLSRSLCNAINRRLDMR